MADGISCQQLIDKLNQEQERQVDLATALGENAPDLSKKKEK